MDLGIVVLVWFLGDVVDMGVGCFCVVGGCGWCCFVVFVVGVCVGC